MDIKITDKMISKKAIGGELVEYVYLAFEVVDGDDTVGALFKQDESMTENLIGITDYGAMFFNSKNTTDESASVTIVAITVNGEVTASKTVLDLKQIEVGSSL